jgi:hypothetical protein
MRSNGSNEIVINGVRYNVAIRLDTNWSYIAEWSVRGGLHKPAIEERPSADPEREATDMMQQAHLRQEPWLYAEIASAEMPESGGDAGVR